MPFTGNCSAGGSYFAAGNKREAFVANEVNGAWRKATQVPGTASRAPVTLPATHVASVDCPTAGNCAVVGTLDGKPGLRGHLSLEK